MARLPVIVGFGGFNAAGRSSFHQSYQRMVLDKLSQAKRQETLAGLATMMQKLSVEQGTYQTDSGEPLSLADIESRYRQDICDNTLIREIRKDYFDIDQAPFRQNIALGDTEQNTLSFTLSRRQIPKVVPREWQITELDSKQVRVEVNGSANVSIPSSCTSSVRAAGQLPSGFNPGSLYNSRFHPRCLQLSIAGASDAIHSMGIDWETILQHISPDQVGAYSSSLMTQLDHYGLGGVLQSRLKGERVTTKQLPLGLGSMASDFINAYVIGNLGTTGSITGACASFLYNLKAGVEDIKSGRCRVVIVSSSEAPILPEVIEGYANMGALATAEKLSQVGELDLRRSSRPFSDNCGFVIAESTQHVVLMDDELAVELGADIHGAVTDVFACADGFKKSISAPGPGNYISFAKAVASVRSILGDQSLAERSFVQAHGSSTPQNRVTESEIFDRVAEAFGITQWPIAAVKAYVGHSLAPASGDQLVNSLGIFAQGIFPGIKTIDEVAADVYQQRLNISNQDRELEQPMDAAFLNSKGFGGNNATACILSPMIVESMLQKRYGSKVMSEYQSRREDTRLKANAYHQQFLQGDFQTIYHFGENLLDDKSIELTKENISIPGYGRSIDLMQENLYKDMF